MTYPQIPASKAVLNGLSAYRLFTPLASPGDIYEIDASILALAVDPNSDISDVKVDYFDPDIPTSLMNEVIVSPDRSFVNTIYANLGQPYPTSGGKMGRLLVSPANLYDPTYVPIGGAGTRVQRYTPNLGVIGYFGQAPSVVPERSDARWSWDYVLGPILPAGVSWVVFPYYGRRYGSFSFVNWMGGGVTVTVEIRGVNFTTDSANLQDEKQLLAPTVVAAAGGVLEKVIRASVDGMWDAIAISYQPSAGSVIGPIPTRIVTSDNAL